MIKGARQVGKTEAVRHFAEAYYESYIEINFVERPEFKEIVRDGFSVDSLIRNIFVIDPSLHFSGLFENIAGEALVKAGVSLAYYKRDNSTLEMDFLARSADCLVPIEVKAENI